MNLSFRVKAVYFDQIRDGQKDFELRAWKKYWNRRFGGGRHQRFEGGWGIFINGKRTHTRKITRIHMVNSEERMGRPLTHDEKKMVGDTAVWCIELGEAL